MPSSTCQHPVMLAPLLEDAFFYPLYNFGFFVKNQLYIGVYFTVIIFNLIPMIHISVFMPTTSNFYYSSSIVELEVRSGGTSRCSLFLWVIFLTILGFLFFHMKLGIVLLMSLKNFVSILMGFAFNL